MKISNNFTQSSTVQSAINLKHQSNGIRVLLDFQLLTPQDKHYRNSKFPPHSCMMMNYTDKQ
ncbi:hypothetical protein T06_1950 [Trichinella sp. T6]|nr:hypothetical protein T06_1950 [Trichinella sp. T6]